jgi:tripartite-type tricarboxylate transporter receptor subunit TctC
MADRSSRRSFLRTLALGAGSSALSFCSRRPDPQPGDLGCAVLAGRRIYWVVPNESGGGGETISRVITSQLATVLNAQVVLDIRPGAGGLIGAKQIRDAPLDGRTLGIINASGLITAILAGDHAVPNPLTDFTILSRVTRSRHILATAASSPLKNMADLFELARSRPIVFGLNDVASPSFVSATLMSHILDFPVQIVSGYGGSRESILATLRGEVDVSSYNFDSIFDQIKNGELRPLLQISDESLSNHPAFQGVLVLGGPNGLAVARARSRGRDVDAAEADAHTAAALIGAGRLVVAPLGMSSELNSCLAGALNRVVTSDALRSIAASANITLDIADAKIARAEIADLREKMDRFIPIVQSAIERIRH